MSNKCEKILLVDDDPCLSKLVTMILELENYIVVAAHDGEQTIAYLDNHAVDLIVLNLFMPILDGADILHWLRDKNISGIPVLLVTGMIDDKAQSKMIDLGANDVLKKPLDAKKIIQSIEGILNK